MPDHPIITLVFEEFQGERVHAKTLASGLRSIVKDVAEVPAAATADDFYARSKKVTIFTIGDVLWIDRLKEAGPACARIILCTRTKKGQRAACTDIDAFLFAIAIEVIVGAFGASFSKNYELLGSQSLLPLFF